MTSDNSNEIFCNIDLVINIYNMLEFNDQLNLSQVNDFLKGVFDTYIWREKYKTMVIMDKSTEVVVTNETLSRRVDLTYDQLSNFLDSFDDQVRILEVRNIKRHNYMEMSYGSIILEKNLDFCRFRNLNCLIFHTMAVNIHDIELVANVYDTLEDLRLMYCVFDSYDINILFEDAILKFQSLKTFYFYGSRGIQRLDYCNFRKFVNGGTIECLKIKAKIMPTTLALGNHLPANSVVQLKELRVDAAFQPEKWASNFGHYLKYFENLSSLRLFIDDHVTDDILATIAVTCHQLQRFMIENTYFKRVKRFAIAPNVTELSLVSCHGLTTGNLVQLITQKKITKFCSLKITYEGDLEPIQLSPLIEDLNVEHVFTYDLIKTIPIFNNLKTLTWYNPSLLNVTELKIGACKKLETLTIKDTYLALHTLKELPSLRKLTLVVPRKDFKPNWPYLTGLLLHLNLTEYTVKDFHDAEDDIVQNDEIPVEVPITAFASTIANLEIPVEISPTSTALWLDLFRRNKWLLRQCSHSTCCQQYVTFLETLIYFDFIPESLNIVDVCGFAMDCNLLREKRIETDLMERLANVLKDTNYGLKMDYLHFILKKN